MEAIELSEVGNALRRSTVWRDDHIEVFSRSVHKDDDEEALKWAALERLPTYKRLRKGLLPSSFGDFTEVDVHNLGFHERKNLIERLVKDAETDNGKFLLKLKERNDRVGIKLDSIEVRFENLSIEADAYTGSRALPTFFNYHVNILEGILLHLHMLSSRKKRLSIIRNVSGIIKPSRMTLLLGPPSSGKTTLLLALAGKLDPDLKVAGKVTYNGHDMDEFVPQRTASYISQYDLHLPEMTVRETLAFSARFQGVGLRHDLLAELSRREIASNIKPDPDIDIFMKGISMENQKTSVVTDYILKVLGLEVCADTIVGDAMIRGISGGQRKRVTTGEMLAGPAKALFMDEISTGLDSSTTFQIVKSLRQIIHIFNGTALISLLQPAPETFELFDDIILLSEGQIVYQGPREFVLEFFESTGFKCPERKAVADFLQEVTSSKDQKQYWVCKDIAYKYVTVKEFAHAFRYFHVGRRLEEELASPFDKRKSNPYVLAKNKYGVGKKELLKACFARELLLMKRNLFFYVFKLIQLITMALFSMTLFFRTEMHRNSIGDGGVYMGALFNSMVVAMFNGMSELGLIIFKLPVFYKQRDLFFFPAWAYALPTWILTIPISFLEVSVWVFSTYYVTGFDPSVKRLFKQYLVLVLVHQMASSLFRFIGSVGRNVIVAGTFGSFVLLALFANGGFVLSRDNIKKWWIWGYWMSPMMYGQNAIAVNEFLGKSWNQTDSISGERLGILVLKSRGLFPYAYWYWIGVGALIGFILICNLGYILALTYLNPLDKLQPLKSQQSQSEELESEILEREERPKSATFIKRNACRKQKKGMILPFQQLTLTFDEITYSVPMPMEIRNQGVLEDKLVLLKGVSGAFRPGILTALMGVSGAGKTTLMDVLAGRKTGGYVEGNITVSGYPKKQETFARIFGYCEQNDIHSPHITVYESLVYSAWLRLPSNVDLDTRKIFVEEVMELVELDTLRKALVGLPGVNGLSNEQRKRLTIAVELLANPSIIFMDEPTSGLDARAAAIVMRTVRNTVDTGRTVVCTIHQPNIDIFEAFDELLLLKRGGEEIYVGPLGKNSSRMIEYFEGIKGVRKIEEGSNPATWMLEVTSSAQEIMLDVNFSDLFKKSELYRRNKYMIGELSKPRTGSNDLNFPTKYSQSFLQQCSACLWKQYWSYWRNPSYTAVRFLFTTFTALLFGTMYWNLGSKRTNTKELFDSLGSMYAAVLFLGIQYAGNVQSIISIERTVYYRERASGMYSALPYALAQIMIELPYILVQALVYGVIVYAMMGFEWSVVKFFWFIFFIYFTLLYFTFYGMMTVAVTPNYHIAIIVSSAFYGIWNLFCGFIIPRPRIPIWWRWYYWFSPVSWTLYGLVCSQFGDVKSELETGQSVEEFLRDYYGFHHDFIGVVAVVVVGFTLLFAFTFAFSIKIFNFQKR